MTFSVTFTVPGSKNAVKSVTFTPDSGLHSPTYFTKLKQKGLI